MASSYHELVTTVRSKGAGKFVSDMKKAGKSVQDFNEKTKRTKRTGGAASAAIVNLGRGASDARYGFAGLANNLEAVVELLGHAATEAKSTGKSVIKQLGGAIVGPAGIVAAISILIAYGPEIIQFFKDGFGDDRQQEIDKAKEEVEKLNEALKDTKNFLSEISLQKIIDVSKLNIAQDELKALQTEFDSLYLASLSSGQGGADARARRAVLSGRIAEKKKEVELLQSNVQASQELYNTEVQNYNNARRRISALRVQIGLADELGLSEADILRRKIEIIDLENKFILTGEAINRNLEERKILVGKLNAELKKTPTERPKVTGALEITPRGISKVNVPDNPSRIQDSDSYRNTFGFGPDVEKYEEVLMWNKILGDSFTDLGNTIATMTTNSKNLFTVFLGAMVQGLSRYVSATIAANAKVVALRKAGASADAIKAATDSAAATPGVGAFILPALIGAALAAVSSAFSGGTGGSVSKPSFAGGSVRNTGVTPKVFQNNPLNNQIQGELVARGTDLVYVFNKANGIRNQYIGG